MNNEQQKIIKSKLGLLQLAEELGNVSRACKLMGFKTRSMHGSKSTTNSGLSKARCAAEEPRWKPSLTESKNNAT